MLTPTSAKLILVADNGTEVLNCVKAAIPTSDSPVLHSTTRSQTLTLLDERHSDIGLIVIDLDLLASGGFDLIGVLTRRDPQHQKTIIAITRFYRGQFVKQVLTLGVDVVLRKPIQARKLVETVKAVLRAA